jgi:hypothetical protein
MADREEIAATLAAGLLAPIDLGSGCSAEPDQNEKIIGWAAHQAVAVYRAVLAELEKEGDEDHKDAVLRTARELYIPMMPTIDPA